MAAMILVKKQMASLTNLYLISRGTELLELGLLCGAHSGVVDDTRLDYRLFMALRGDVLVDPHNDVVTGVNARLT